MASPLPADPYEALGVTKDADLSAVRIAHRKLALKHHPDRIKDEAQREKGKDEFQKIQQAYEILSDPQRKQRYDDQVRLAELRKEAMMRGPPSAFTATTRAYPMRPAPQPAPPSTREYNDNGFFEEVRQPREQPRDSYDHRDPYDDLPRSTSRKHAADYDRRPPPPPRPAEKSRKPSTSSSAWTSIAAATMAASKIKAQAEKIRNRKADEARSDKEKTRDRKAKVETRRPANFENTDSDSDHTEVRPSMKSTRSTATSYFDRPTERPRSSPRNERTKDVEEESFDDNKWERHHEESMAYITKANRPGLDRVGSDAFQYWVGSESKAGGRRSGSDNEKRPTSSKGRRSSQQDYFSPPLNKSTSSPSHLRANVEERTPPRPNTRERERERERERDKERERERGATRTRMPPSLNRSQTMPPLKPSSAKKDTAPTKGSNLKHGETHMHDSGYGSSSSPHTPEMREDSPPRSTRQRYPSTTSTKYQIVDPEPEHEDRERTPRVREIYDDFGERSGRRYDHSPETIVPDSTRGSERRRDKPERPRVDTKKSSKSAAMMQDFIPPPSPTMRRSESGRYDDRPAPRSPHDTPPISRNNSGRADNKLFGELSSEEREPSRYTRPYPADKVNVTSRGEPQYSQYEYREPESRSRFREAPSRMTSRRPSVGAY